MTKFFSYEEALKDSLDYFKGDELAAKVFLDKYALRDLTGQILENTPEMMHHRISNEFARIEAGKFKTPLSKDEIFGLIERFKYIVPQGSPMFGIGNDFQLVSLSNCFLLDVPLDSYGSILKVDEQLVNISKRRGGVGIDLSNLRPAGTATMNAARASTGIVSFMERYSNSIREVGQGGRRGALMLTLSIHHPDVEAFCTIKNDPMKVTGANISVRLTKEFLAAVRENTDFELRFPVDCREKGEEPKFTKMVSARALWKIIIHSAWLKAEPGLLMWDNFTENTPADYYEEYKSRGTNPCSELNLSPLDSCRLLCLNLLSYVKSPFTKAASFDFDLFHQHAKLAQRLMDDMVDLESEKIDKIIAKVNNDPEPMDVKSREIEMWEKIKRFNNEGRRTGTGIVALGDTLAALGVKYGSTESIEVTEKIYQALKLACYESSVEMAKELGAFKGYSADAEKKCPFIERIATESPSLYAKMVKHGRRNISLLTTAPTGSVAIMTQTTSGIEPLFMIGYTRRKKINPNDKNTRVDFTDQNGDSWQEFTVYHNQVAKWMEVTGETNIKKSPWYGCCAEEIDWINRVKLQAAAQKHVCHAISSTINLPENVTQEKVAEIYEMAFASGCKGMTIYRKNCRTGVLVDDTARKNEEVKLTKTNPPKRPKALKGDIHHFSLNKQKFYVAVGLFETDVYEVFTGVNHSDDGEVYIPKDIKHGEIVKNARGSYIFNSDGHKYHLTNGHSDDTADALTRVISCALRHGSDVSFITHQLEKTKGPLLSFTKILARTLKKYIPDGTKVKGDQCPECKSESIVRQSGCCTCTQCGFSKCM